jgi:rhodanese-related sulfurtransferase
MSAIKRVSAREAKALLDEGYTFLDVRTEAEFAAGHPVGALNVPYAFSGPSGMTPNPEFVALATKLFPKDARLVLGCRSGNRSMKAAALLIDAGFSDLVDLRPGWDGVKNAFGQVTEKGWAAEALPTETETPGGSFAELTAKAAG